MKQTQNTKKETVSTKNQQTKHFIELENRKKLNISGVKDVISYNEQKIIVQTTQGTLDIEGKELNIQELNLSNSKLKINGLIKSLNYSNREPQTSLLKKLFR